jgi:hypothetical protein
MIVFEKLRAICQQMPEYRHIIGKSHGDARARDFFDIYTVVEHFEIDLTSVKNLELLTAIFDAKKVPLYLLNTISEYREFHRPDFYAVQSTIKPHIKLKDFDFYFDYVFDKSQRLLKSLGVK